MKRLYYFPVAPNPTKVRLYVAEKQGGGADLGIHEIQVSLAEGEQNTAAQRARSPLARLPTLELEDGSHVIESLPIIELLEELHPEPAMIGRDPRERARVRDLERIADMDVLLPTARLVHATNSPLGIPPSPEIAARARESLPKALRYLDGVLADGRAFAAGEHVTIADCTLAAGLHFGRFGGIDVSEGFDNLRRWDRAYRAREEIKGVLLD
jgi:glutathione S-transferase